MAGISELLKKLLKDYNYFKGKDTVNNTSFLYIKSFLSDSGQRPFDPTQDVFWSSDLKMVPTGPSPDPVVSPFQWFYIIQRNTNYKITCTLTNTGDLGVTAANLEFFKLDFEGDNSIFNPRVDYSAKMEVGQQMHAVQEHGQTLVECPWNSGDYLGLMAIAARVTSQSPVDLPNDWDTLNPREDRHCANYSIFWYYWGTTMTFLDTTSEQDYESQYRYLLSPTLDHQGSLRTELSKQGLKLQSAPRTPKFHFEAKVSTPVASGVPTGGSRLIAPISLGVLGRLRQSVSGFWNRSSQWDFNFPKSSKVTVKMKPLGTPLRKNQVLAYDLVKVNRKTKKEEGRVTILYAQN